MTEATTAPNPADFSVDERPREYCVTLCVEGTMEMTVEADSPEQARQMAEDLAGRVAEGKDAAELDGVADVRVSFVSKALPFYRVLRGEKVMQTTRLRPGDQPREPDERGF